MMQQWEAAQTLKFLDEDDMPMDEAPKAAPVEKKRRQIVPPLGTEHICFVCLRKFVSEDKLRDHERSSILHKTNLELTAVASVY